ncbi:MAG: LysR family transcriptional regulator [Kordiimonadaceae bacterium]|jgi:DNA-binding transcriptional LysR family regulator|nr:LysR family transcriptional regulator [Kordiimonadaceae bacterium]MBT6031279.1 LysR family transcriptional regulator [Kordiimonadaceae bacterium]
MKIVELKSFLEIASHASFSKAASHLNYAHSSVTAQIKSLEHSVGAELFIRDRRGVELTDAGKRFHKYARQIVDLSRDGKQAVQNSPLVSGPLTIGAVETISTYRLPELLGKIQEQAPDVQISFKIMSDKELYESIKMGTLDIAFLVEEELLVANTEVLKICDEPVSMYVKPDHPLAGKKVKTTELGDYHHLLWSRECCYSAVVHKELQKAGIHSFNFMEFINTETIKQCALAGMGIATLTEITVEKEVEEGKLVKLDWDIGKPFHSFILWNKYRANYPALNYLIDLTKQHFKLS